MTPERTSKSEQRVSVLAQEQVDLTEEGLPLVLIVELDLQLNELQRVQNARTAAKHIELRALNIYLQAVRSQLFAGGDFVERHNVEFSDALQRHHRTDRIREPSSEFLVRGVQTGAAGRRAHVKIQTLVRAAQRVRKKAASAAAGRRQTPELIRIRLETDGVQNLRKRTPACLQTAACADVEHLYGPIPKESFEYRHVTPPCPRTVIDEKLEHAESLNRKRRYAVRSENVGQRRKLEIREQATKPALCLVEIRVMAKPAQS